ncbi:stationary phase inducible protein CsiE [[Enterobacter] lignolyticus]|uniref:Stationary phase inducible protein CsiE n=1 Tax=[Enterobacter] lignolyticus TaxID=1334193 RepID=A0A806XG68_9ENTR|nr:stationary phase inducible protein CsiE [[Enterobacter] lignolyticus]ALR77691.1 stationary phase inducible protein CsiE [[Enterobacter] lignolyticus]
MMTLSEPPSVLSSPQRRCQILLMLFLPGQSVTQEYIARANNVDDEMARMDIAETRHEVQRYHRLNIVKQADGSYRIEGTILDQRLCLLHWLRRALRLCPQFIAHQFTPVLKTQLKQSSISRILYDDTNLYALVNRCARGLHRQFDGRDVAFLRLYLQYCLLQQTPQNAPQFTVLQRRWAQASAEFQVVADIVRHWQRRTLQTPHPDEHLFLALLFMMLKVPDPYRDQHIQDIRLTRTINQLIDRFQLLSGRQFADRQGLRNQLYVHLAQAMNRSLYGVGIDNTLPDEIHRLYPRLMRTTQDAMAGFEADHALRFSMEEMGLIAVIFGAWLMQEDSLHEKQVVLLTGDDPDHEQQIEQQLRELTLLPISIKYQTLREFQRDGAPKGVSLVVTPYSTSLPLFSPPIIHAGERLSDNQCQHICQMLEAG